MRRACQWCVTGAGPSKGHLPEKDAVAIVKALASAGFEKINFAGGEPTLCPWLPNLINEAHNLGMVTSMVTNGSRVNSEFLDAVAGTLDWVAVSVDSANDPTNIATGRSVSGLPLSISHVRGLFDLMRLRRVRLKVNTVVTAANWQEDLTPLILDLHPERWKVFQVLPVVGQNDVGVSDLLITDAQFTQFVARHRSVGDAGIRLVAESNDLMTGSYVMVDPAGRFFDNVEGQHRYSRPILEVGVPAALGGVQIDAETFRRRDGVYDWQPLSLQQLGLRR
jgi:radical S-adenosyl methionine domain-containing protein 2